MAYLEAMKHFDDDVLEKAFFEAGSSLRFFPKPVELVEIIEGKADEQAMVAWGFVQEAFRRAGQYNSVLFADSRIARAIELPDGWVKLCRMEGEEADWGRREFLKTYRSISQGGDPRGYWQAFMSSRTPRTAIRTASLLPS